MIHIIHYCIQCLHVCRGASIFRKICVRGCQNRMINLILSNLGILKTEYTPYIIFIYHSGFLGNTYFERYVFVQKAVLKHISSPIYMWICIKIINNCKICNTSQKCPEKQAGCLGEVGGLAGKFLSNNGTLQCMK